jgi:hypothetical protein
VLPAVPLQDRETFKLEIKKRLPRAIEIIDEALTDGDLRARWTAAIEVLRYAAGTHPAPPEEKAPGLADAAAVALAKIRAEQAAGAYGGPEGRSSARTPAKALISGPSEPLEVDAPPEPVQAKLDPIDAEIEAELAEWDEAHRRGR